MEGTCPIWARLGTGYEFLAMRRVISGRKRYRNTNNLEKSDFFVEIFFDIWPKTENDPAHHKKLIFLENSFLRRIR